MNLNYSYQVVSIDIAGCHMVVKYLPEDEDLSPISYNNRIIERSFQDIRDENNQLLFQSQEEVPFSYHLEYSCKYAAPLDLWRKQKLLIENYQLALNMSGNVSV